MIEFKPVLQDEYYENPTIINGVEAVNRLGLVGVYENTTIFRTDQNSIPLAIIKPASHRLEDPLDTFDDGVIVRSLGAANDFLPQQLTLSALVSEITGKPVISVPFPNRNWTGSTVEDRTKRWSSASDDEKKRKAVRHLDGYADHVLETIDRFITLERGVGKLACSGESLGAALALSLSHRADRLFDTSGVSVTAVPNAEERRLYSELFLKDFLASSEGLFEQATSGPVQLEPFVEALGFSEGKNSALSDLKSGMPYLLRDLFGLFPPDVRMELYKNNRALIRTLTVAIGLELIERLNARGNSRQVDVAGLEKDLVAKPIELKNLGTSRCTPTNTDFSLFEGLNHTGCNNPYIIGHMAAKLAV